MSWGNWHVSDVKGYLCRFQHFHEQFLLGFMFENYKLMNSLTETKPRVLLCTHMHIYIYIYIFDEVVGKYMP